MLLDTMIPIRMHYKNKDHYESHGYKYKSSRIINVWTYQINPTSHEMVWVKCDYCGKYFRREFRLYLSLQFEGLDNCEDCKSFKTIQTCNIKYGCDNPAQSEEIKQKIKNTNMDRFGVEYSSQSQLVKDKVKNTVLEKYGYESALQVPEIREKGVQTCIKKYGESHYNKTEYAKENFKKTFLEKYGVENPTQLDEIKNKAKATCLEKYGEDNIFKTEKFKADMIERNMSMYGVTHYSKTEECKKKVENTCLSRYKHKTFFGSEIGEKRKLNGMLKKYGVKNYRQSKELLEKSIKKICENNNCPTSSQQIKIFNAIKEKYPNAEINYPNSNSIFDIALFINDIKIDIEYDGYYWHDEKKDRRRDEYFKSKGWKVLRIKSGHKLPDNDVLFKKIESLIVTDKKYSQIILSDWGG